MSRLFPDQLVKLREAIPELGLRMGEAGVICSVWYAPAISYEVEFPDGLLGAKRTLLMEHQLIRAEHSLSVPSSSHDSLPH